LAVANRIKSGFLVFVVCVQAFLDDSFFFESVFVAVPFFFFFLSFFLEPGPAVSKNSR